jgi:hypothetical protein
MKLMNLYAPSTHLYAPIRTARHKQVIINVECLQSVARAPDPWRK